MSGRDPGAAGGAAVGRAFLIALAIYAGTGAAFGLACIRFVGIRCEGPAGVT